MPKGRIYGEVKGVGDITKINQMIRKDVKRVGTRPRLTELHKRSQYIVTLTFAPVWKTAFRGKIVSMRKMAREEFTKTAKAINARAKKLGLKADYDEKWGPGR